MHMVATVILVVSLALLLLLGFLRVAHELLSRCIYEVPSPDDAVSSQLIERDSGRREPVMLECGGHPIESCMLTKQSGTGKPGQHHVTA
jgi:hypothetical protein